MRFSLIDIIWALFLIASAIVLALAARRDYLTREVIDAYPLSLVGLFLLGKVACIGAFFLCGKTMSGTDLQTDWQTLLLTEIAAPVIRAAFVFAILLALTLLLEKVCKREMFGGADIKILGTSALYINVEQFLLALLIACVSLIVIAITCKNKRGLRSTFPFVVYYCVGYSFVVACLLTSAFV